KSSDAVLDVMENDIINMAQGGDLEGAKRKYKDEYLAKRWVQENAIRDMERIADQSARRAYDMAMSSYATARWITWLLLAGLVGAGVLIPRILSQNLADPIQRMAATVELATRGDLSKRPEFDARSDELGALSRSMNLMYDYLGEMAKVADSINSGDLT